MGSRSRFRGGLRWVDMVVMWEGGGGMDGGEMCIDQPHCYAAACAAHCTACTTSTRSASYIDTWSVAVRAGGPLATTLGGWGRGCDAVVDRRRTPLRARVGVTTEAHFMIEEADFAAIPCDDRVPDAKRSATLPARPGPHGGTSTDCPIRRIHEVGSNGAQR